MDGILPHFIIYPLMKFKDSKKVKITTNNNPVSLVEIASCPIGKIHYFKNIFAHFLETMII